MPDFSTVVVTGQQQVATVAPVTQVVRVSQGVPGSYDAVARLGLGIYNIVEYGAVGDGSTDCSPALASAIAAATLAGRGVIYAPPGQFRVTSTIALPANTVLWGAGVEVTQFIRGFTGDFVTIANVAYAGVRDCSLVGDYPTYRGKGIVISGSGSTRPMIDNVRTFDLGLATDSHLEFGADAGTQAVVSRVNFRRSGAPIDFRAIHTNGPDTPGVARNRIFSQVQCGDSYIDISGAVTSQFVCCEANRWVTDANTNIALISSSLWANSGSTMTLKGLVMNVIGCRLAGSVILDTSYRGSFIGNTFTDNSYTLTDNTINPGSAVIHADLDEYWVRYYNDMMLQGALRFNAATGEIFSGGTSVNIRDFADSFNILSLFDTGTVIVPVGPVYVGLNADTAERAMVVNNAAGYQRAYETRAGNLRRWRFFDEADTESGSNAGATKKLDAYDDAGTLIGTVMQWVRAAGGLVSVFRNLAAKRFFGNGTALATTDFVVSSGWGTNPTLAVTGTDSAFRFSVTAQATTGANPTVTFTFKDGTWTNLPELVYTRGDTNATSGRWALSTRSATAPVFTFVGTPVAGETYILDGRAEGK